MIVVDIIKKYIDRIKLVVYLLVLGSSIILNVYFLLGKGIVINNNNTSVSNSTSTSNSYSSSGSVAIGYIGDTNKGKWKVEAVTFFHYEDVIKFLNERSVGEFLLTKVVYEDSRWRVYYGDFSDTKNNKQVESVKRTVNGIEVKQ